MAEEAPAEVELCLRCQKEPIKFLTLPCRHRTLCAACAARVATGGKCFVCHKFFQRLKHIPLPGEEAEEEEEEAQPTDDDDDDDEEGAAAGRGGGVDDAAARGARSSSSSSSGGWGRARGMASAGVVAAGLASAGALVWWRRRGVGVAVSRLARLVSGAALGLCQRRSQGGVAHRTLVVPLPRLRGSPPLAQEAAAALEAAAAGLAAAGTAAAGSASAAGAGAAGAAGAAAEAAGEDAAAAEPLEPCDGVRHSSEPPLEVHLLDLARMSGRAAADALAGLAAQAAGCLGLDAEWPPELQPGSRHRISVLQLSAERRCWVLKLRPDGAAAGAGAGAAQAGPGLPDAVVQLLCDPGVVKSGVGIQEDVKRLERDFGIKVRGAVDVRLVAQRVAPACLAGGSSLQALSRQLLGRQLDKSPQRSDWGAAQLDERQVAYAAHDAWLSRELLCALHRLHQQPAALQQQQQQPRSAADHAGSAGQPQPAQQAGGQREQQLALPEGGACGGPSPGPLLAAPASPPSDSLLAFASPFADVFSGISHKRAGDLPGGGAKVAAAMRDGKAAAGGGEGVVPAGSFKLPTRKSELYENCRLLAPDGAVLCTCGSKKVRFYLQRGLARLVSEDPVTIQLSFEPRGRGNSDDNYYLADKENRCCVCGSELEYVRHSVVPHCYRKHFPTYMKSHLSHDIVLMCPPCHKVSSYADQRRMEQLGAQYGAPLGAATAAKFRTDADLGAVRSAGRALTNKKVVIPAARRVELEAVLLQHFGVQALDEDLLQQASNMETQTEDENWRSHAQVVVATLGGQEELEAFVRGWRRHFLATMQPRFMPPHWNVDARVANSSAVA
ncbi:Exonuclease 3'-5' domain-containing protein 2 [Tetrabaena socialis]|uniref:Exonuclease 3'-5' domain-containing protein 2 n=1 Tax=Tetrabaena socialis TaxID=47790 RepID=A0A2J8ADH2_9CHLO|nr:Exonuclease 3'-5' domain-containing protein 2 [Tetrabaena socialis]|eukprot:PNH10564.1 Exonuclease 3'-5' domain-containing protein 2 [Tetrabaena socialis]